MNIQSILIVEAYFEPQEFIVYFHGWTRDKIPNERRNPEIECVMKNAREVFESLTRKTYSIEVLKSGRIPANVDPTRLEVIRNE